MVGVISQLGFIIFLPVMVSAGSVYFVRAGISRPWLLFVLGTAVLYVAYVAIFYATADTLAGGFAVSKVDRASPARVRSLGPNLLVFYGRPLLIFVFAAIPILFGLRWFFRRP